MYRLYKAFIEGVVQRVYGASLGSCSTLETIASVWKLIINTSRCINEDIEEGGGQKKQATYIKVDAEFRKPPDALVLTKFLCKWCTVRHSRQCLRRPKGLPERTPPVKMPE